MKRNSIEEKEKHLRRLAKRSREIWREARELDWVPVEEPQFLGWEVQAVLGESGLRRGDVDNLRAIMKYFDMNRVVFTRHESIKKIIRANGGNYLKSLDQIIKKAWRDKPYCYYDTWSYIDRYYMPYFNKTVINQHVYDSVPEHLKKFFERRVEKATMYRPEYYYYILSSKFPLYELKLKVTRCYSTHRGIPRSEVIQEHDFLEDLIDREGYYRGRWGGETWWNHNVIRITRKAWNKELKVVAKQATLDDVESTEPSERRLGRQTHFDWDF